MIFLAVEKLGQENMMLTYGTNCTGLFIDNQSNGLDSVASVEIMGTCPKFRDCQQFIGNKPEFKDECILKGHFLLMQPDWYKMRARQGVLFRDKK
jgi:hypothetical protein